MPLRLKVRPKDDAVAREAVAREKDSADGLQSLLGLA